MKERLKIDLGIILIIILCILFLIQISDVRNASRKWYSVDSARDLFKTLSWLREHSQPDDVILTTWTFGCQVVTYADRKVIATSKVYPSEIKTVAERYRDITNFFFSQSETDALEVIHKYNIKYILLPRKFDFWTCRYIGVCDLTPNKRAVSDTDKKMTMVDRMLDCETLTNFILCYSSKRYIIYKLLDDV